MNFLEVFRRYKTLSKKERQTMFIYWSPIFENYKIFNVKQAKYLDSPVWDNHKLFRLNDKEIQDSKFKIQNSGLKTLNHGS